MASTTTVVPAVYGPVRSWRFGQSLGIDLLGADSTCSFRCQYCQLGDIDQFTCTRDVFVPTEQVQTELAQRDWGPIDVVTFSGSGEPTLACNLGEVVALVRQVLQKPVVVLTNGTLLGDRAVQYALNSVDMLAVKLDAVTREQWQAINRPIDDLNLDHVLSGMMAFRKQFSGTFALQTMVMQPWSAADEARYKTMIQALQPDEVQLNTPLRPRPLNRQLAARGNVDEHPDRGWRYPRCVTPQTLAALSQRLQTALPMPVRYRYEPSSTHTIYPESSAS